jgi:hypothetical protein
MIFFPDAVRSTVKTKKRPVTNTSINVEGSAFSGVLELLLSVSQMSLPLKRAEAELSNYKITSRKKENSMARRIDVKLSEISRRGFQRDEKIQF